MRNTDTLAMLIKKQVAGQTLEQGFYTNADIFQNDLDAIWMRQWLYAGHAAQIPNPGDYFLYNIGSESVIVLRGDDGEIRALANVCRHRGSLLCNEPSGTVKKLVCPYHQWVYDRHGALLSAKQMPLTFDRASYGLIPVACRVLDGGFVFVCFADAADLPPFDDFATQFAPHVRFYTGLESSTVGATATYTVKANWKLIAENFRECYHCGVGHPEYCKIISGANLASDQGKFEAYRAAKFAEWEAKCVPTDRVWFDPGVYRYCERYPYEPGLETMSLDGSFLAPLWNDGLRELGDIGAFSMIQYPNCWIDINRDYAYSILTG